MTTTITPQRQPDQSEAEGRLTPVRRPATTARPRSDRHPFDPTQGRQIGSNPYDDPTQGRKLGSDPYDDPTQGRQIGSHPDDDPTRTR